MNEVETALLALVTEASTITVRDACNSLVDQLKCRPRAARDAVDTLIAQGVLQRDSDRKLVVAPA